MKDRQVSLTSENAAGHTARLLVDGKDISRSVGSLHLTVDAREAHQLHLHLTPFPIDVLLEGVRVYVDSETADVLTWLGWTPPPEEDTG